MKPFGHVPVIMEKKMVRNSEKMQVMVRLMLMDIYLDAGIDVPKNNDAIVEFVTNDVSDAAQVDGELVSFSSEDVKIAFRRLIEKAAEDLIP